MKKLILCLALACAVPFAQTGCAPISQSAQSATYKTLAGIGETVDVAMKQAARAKVAGRLTEHQWQEVAKVHADYILAYTTAVDAGATSAAPAPEKVLALAAQISALLASFLPTPS